MKPPYNGSSDTDSGHEVFNVAVEADGDASEILDPAKGSFNDVALFGSVPLAISHSRKAALSYPLSAISCFDGGIAAIQALAAL